MPGRIVSHAPLQVHRFLLGRTPQLAAQEWNLHTPLQRQRGGAQPFAFPYPRIMKTPSILLRERIAAATISLAFAGCSSDEASSGAPADAAVDDSQSESATQADVAVSDGDSLDTSNEAVDGDPAEAGVGGAGGASGAGGAGGEGGIERGLSAWVYENRDSWADDLNEYDTSVQGEKRVRYLFPYVGGVEVSGSVYGSQSVWFDTEVMDFYAARMPNTKMLPIFDSADGAKFASWSDADQRKLATDVADQLLASSSIAGAQIDIEPFRVEHLPFYEELGQRLHSEGKLLTVFTGASSGDIYSIADVVVLSGYDLGMSPVTPTKYRAVLDDLVGAALQSAAAAGSRLMVGVPIAASWEEYETQTGTCDQDTGFTQVEWFSAALGAVCAHTSHASYLGLSLWGFYGDALEIPRGSGCFRHPGAVPPANWVSLTNWGDGGCL